MTERVATQILQTTVRPDGPNAARVDLTVADAPRIEDATVSIVVSVRVTLESETRPFAEYQRQAAKTASSILADHWRSLDNLLKN